MTSFEISLLTTCQEKGFYPRSIGSIKGPDKQHPTWFIQTVEDKYSIAPKALIVSGFHGEEQAGPWAILKWLKQCTPESFKGVNLSFLPIVNLYGFLNEKRYGPSQMPTNTGFYRQGDLASPEGEILKKNIEMLREAADSGYLSLHEDITASQYYIYTFEPSEKPGEFTKQMKSELHKHFPNPYNGIAYVDTASPGQGPPCEDGLVWKFYDGSFDDYMFQMRVPRVAVPETPGRYPLLDRIDANVALIEKFIELISKGI